MNRPNQKSKWRTFYVPTRGMAGGGIQDRYGRTYIILASGALRCIHKAKHETIKP